MWTARLTDSIVGSILKTLISDAETQSGEEQEPIQHDTNNDDVTGSDQENEVEVLILGKMFLFKLRNEIREIK